MHNAPAVSYPVGRSRFQGCMIGLAGSGGAAAGLLWHFQANPADWLLWIFTMTLGGCFFVAARVWSRAPRGSLQWDGQAWVWTCGQTSSCGALTVHLDVQFCMVLSLRTAVGIQIWLWPERRAAPMLWSALRQAVFSRGATASSEGATARIGIAEFK